MRYVTTLALMFGMIKFEVKKVKQVVAHIFFLFLKFAHLPLLGGKL